MLALTMGGYPLVRVKPLPFVVGASLITNTKQINKAANKGKGTRGTNDKA